RALSADTARVFGFESAADWSSNSTSVPLALSPHHTDGHASLDVTSTGSVSVTSVAVAGPLDATSILACDIIVPHVQSPLWYGQAQVVLNAPSVGLYNEWIGQAAFPFPYAVFQRVQFPLSNALVAKLQSPFTDLQVTLTVTGAAGHYLLDNVRFLTADQAKAPIAPRATSIGQILDFEDPNLWVAFQPTLVDPRDERVHGAQSIALSGFSWTRL